MKEVYIRRTGKDYHRGPQCIMVEPDSLLVPLWLAKKANYIPCPSCYNPSKTKFKEGTYTTKPGGYKEPAEIEEDFVDSELRP